MVQRLRKHGLPLGQFRLYPISMLGLFHPISHFHGHVFPKWCLYVFLRVSLHQNNHSCHAVAVTTLPPPRVLGVDLGFSSGR